MSDYLWDKTGEPDAETERLEDLLGQLRFQPTPFDLPAGLRAQEFRAARAPRSVLSWPRLALAASITLAVLAGAWLALRQQTDATSGERQVASRNQQTDAGEKRSTDPATGATGAANENNAGGENEANATPAPPRGGETQREELGAGGQRPRLPDLDRPRRVRRADAPRANRTESASAPKREKNLATPGAAAARREETARATAEREAAEKVLYALRITSEKLNYARQQVQGAGRGEDNR